MECGEKVIVSGKSLKTYGLEGKISQLQKDKALVEIAGMNPVWIGLKNLNILNADTDAALLNATKHRIFVFIPGHEDTVRKAREGRDIHDALDDAYVSSAPSLEAAVERELETVEDWLDGDEDCVLVYDGERYHEIRRGKVEIKPL